MNPKLTIVYGTRPEARKLRVLADALIGWNLHIIRTGQHTSLLHGCNLPDTVDLGYPALGEPEDYGREVAEMLAQHLPDQPVLVQGDTASAWAGGLAARERGLPLVHLEAGIRSGDLKNPWPEEGFRTDLDAWCDLALCATDMNATHCRTEGIRGRIVVVGNTGIDALYQEVRPNRHVEQNRILLTLHRRESLGGTMVNIIQGIYDVARDEPETEFLWPVHPNPGVRQALDMAGKKPQNVVLSPPLDPVEFVHLLARSRGVITDSGGVQEEAAALGIPCVVCREVTDRPESVLNGRAILAGRMRLGVRNAVECLIRRELLALPTDCFGDGHAVRRIVPLLQRWAVAGTTGGDGIESRGDHQGVVPAPPML